MATVKHQLYAGKVELCFDEARHLYSVGGKKVDGVTSILGVISKPALVPWAAKMTAEYVRMNLKPGVALDEVQIATLCEEAKSAHRKKKEAAGDIGHLVHSWIENYIKEPHGEHEMPVNAQAQSGCNAFLEWVEANHVEFLKSEGVVYSQKYNYAGTFDLTAIVNGKRVLGDIKTSSGIYDEMFFQTSAYENALREEHGEPYEEHLIINCKKEPDKKTGQILEIRSSTEYTENARAFLAALTLYRRIEALKPVKV